ncbi:transient receptor potential cation channel subfamily M member 6 isoform X2 [Clupea harengus]|uniref:non-specific serine/threonine protein kinase n=1 Tax=Clupea harengus TaxID=7950 RepID=A0A6P8FJF1_CLUHA|nr:transient receptor potential cation channel subfamily M member 6 isoform X2 [Clupea harengus]
MPASKTWIEETFFKRECVKFLPASRDTHRCFSVCQVCQNLIRCCCGRLIGEHLAFPLRSLSLTRAELAQDAAEWSVELHTQTSPTDAFGSIDFQDSAKRSCRAKYVRLSCNTKAEQLTHLMLREWQMELPKLVISVHGGAENFPLPPKVSQAFCKGLIRAAETTGAWIFTDGINTGVSRYVGQAMKEYGTHDLRKRNAVGITPWGAIENHTDLIGKDVLKPYQTVGNPLSKRECLNGFHSHFLLVDDGTLGKSGGQLDLRKRLERHIRSQKIHPRLCQGVPVVCVVVEGGPGVPCLVLEYVTSVPPVPVVVFEGTGRAADLLAFVHKQTAVDRQIDRDIKDDLLLRIQDTFTMGRREASELYSILMHCMRHRDAITIFDSDSEDQPESDVAILTASLKGMKASPQEQLSIALAWDRADVAKKHILVYGQHWQVGSLEQALLDALVMDRVSFVKLLIENGMTMNRFLTVSRLEELYNTYQAPTDHFLQHLIEDVRKTYIPVGYRISLIDVGLLIEYLIGGAYRSSYTRKNFRAVYSRLCAQGSTPESSSHFARQKRAGFSSTEHSAQTPHRPHFFRTAQPYKHKGKSDTPSELKVGQSTELSEPSLYVYNVNDLFVWAVLKRRQQMALFLWQHGEAAMARAVVACKLYRAMANEARESNMADSITEELNTYSLEFGQLAVDLLDKAFRENERMAMKLLTSEMKDWSNFTCLQMAVSSSLRSFVAHTCTQMLLTDLWMGRLNMRKIYWFKIVLGILVPVSIQLLDFKSQAEMSHVPQSQEALQFGLDSRSLDTNDSQGKANTSDDAERGAESKEHSSDLFSQWIQCIRKLYDFYNAPVVKFWFHTMSYLAFLMLFSYTVLVRMEDHPSPQEWLVIAYILSTAVEKAREVLMSEPRKFSKKLKVWFSEYWNVSDFVAIFLFLVGFALRWDPSWRVTGRIIYCLDVIFWFIRVLDLLAVNQHAGPYFTMITKMTSNMFYIVIMMAIVLLSFGVSRKAILSPDEDPSWTLAKDVVFQPYWMMFGEVYAGEIDSCAENSTCVPGAFITPFLQAVYLFFQYIILVNTLIAFFNNVYFDMKSISNQLWKYNRYRYIMTYQEKPWLPPPLILLNHVTLYGMRVCKKTLGASEKEQNSGLKLFLGSDDLKKLHEFEGRCVAGYFFEKNENLHSSQINRICFTADKTGESAIVLGEVAEKIHFIQDSLQTLDTQLGHLQDTSALTVDTLSLITASDDCHQRAALYGLHKPISSSHQEVLHNWCLPGGSVPPSRYLLAHKPYSSTPSSPLGGLGACWHSQSLEWQHQGGSEGSEQDSDEEQWKSKPSPHPSDAISEGLCRFSHDSLPHVAGWRDRTPLGSCWPSRTSIPPMPWSSESLDQHQQPRAWHHDSHLPPSQESPNEIEEEEEEEEELGSSAELSLSRTSSHAVLRTDSPADRGRLMGLVNPGFCGDGELAPAQSGRKQQSRKFPRWMCRSRHSRSLSASVENMAFLGAPPASHPPSALASDSPGVDHVDCMGKDTSPPLSQNRELSKSADLTEALEGKKRACGRKTVKIQDENTGNVTEACPHSSDGNKKGRCHGKSPALHKSSTSASLSQLNSDHADWQRSAHSFQATRSPSQSLWSSWAKSNSRRSSIQSGALYEARGSTFQSTEDLHPHYSAMERNNLMRLAHSIPFTPVSLIAMGEEVSVYTLEEAGESTGGRDLSVSSWSPRGLSAILQPLSDEGVLDGGLRRARRVACTWAQEGVLKPGCIYVVKAFRPEVVRMWQKVFHSDTSLHLCLREVQQQTAAQRLMHVFNQLKPQSMRYSPRFLDVSLVHWHSDDQWLTIERYMAGDFRKYNNNTGEEIAPCCGLEDTVLAFSHWTYEYSCRELLVLDLQGVGMELTDPSVIRADDQSTSGDLVFGPANLGNDAIQSFIHKHNCNSCCEKLGLSDLRSRGSTEEAPEEEEDSDSIVTRM